MCHVSHLNIKTPAASRQQPSPLHARVIVYLVILYHQFLFQISKFCFLHRGHRIQPQVFWSFLLWPALCPLASKSEMWWTSSQDFKDLLDIGPLLCIGRVVQCKPHHSRDSHLLQWPEEFPKELFHFRWSSHISSINTFLTFAATSSYSRGSWLPRMYFAKAKLAPSTLNAFKLNLLDSSLTHILLRPILSANWSRSTRGVGL